MKNRIFSSGIFAVFILILLISYNNCGRGLLRGTDTGNPMSGSPITILNLHTEMCLKISGCFPLDLTDCKQTLLTADNITTGLGLDVVQYPHLQDVDMAVSQEILQLNKQNEAICATAVNSLSCNSPLVVSSYSPVTPNNLNNAFTLLQASPSCTQIYQ